ncbi:MAG: hypothetical protein M3478_06945, partial [Planctomycetota bacterium]|nr:hypothetical protein [Planctomycetota bacterium]
MRVQRGKLLLGLMIACVTGGVALFLPEALHEPRDEADRNERAACVFFLCAAAAGVMAEFKSRRDRKSVIGQL